MPKQDSADVRETNLRFRLIVDAIQDYAIYGACWTLAGRITTWNSGAQRTQGVQQRRKSSGGISVASSFLRS